MSVESAVKNQYAKFFTKSDSNVFKLAAEFYLRKAASLKKRDIEGEDTFKLLFRNIQKRLFIGIGCELLLKAFFLRSGYCINLPASRNTVPGNPPYELRSVHHGSFDINSTFTFNQLIDLLPKISVFSRCSHNEKAYILNSLRTAKVFRNKEGHVVTMWHKYDPVNYQDIEEGLVVFYEKAFAQKLEIQFAFGMNQKSKFSVKSV